MDHRLDEWAKLEQGWDSYNAKPPSGQIIKNARAFLKFCETVPIEPTSVLPSIDWLMADVGLEIVDITTMESGGIQSIVAAKQPSQLKIVKPSEVYELIFNLFVECHRLAKCDKENR